MLQAAEESQG